MSVNNDPYPNIANLMQPSGQTPSQDLYPDPRSLNNIPTNENPYPQIHNLLQSNSPQTTATAAAEEKPMYPTLPTTYQGPIIADYSTPSSPTPPSASTDKKAQEVSKQTLQAPKAKLKASRDYDKTIALIAAPLGIAALILASIGIIIINNAMPSLIFFGAAGVLFIPYAATLLIGAYLKDKAENKIKKEAQKTPQLPLQQKQQKLIKV